MFLATGAEQQLLQHFKPFVLESCFFCQSSTTISKDCYLLIRLIVSPHSSCKFQIVFFRFSLSTALCHLRWPTFINLEAVVVVEYTSVVGFLAEHFLRTIPNLNCLRFLPCLALAILSSNARFSSTSRFYRFILLAECL